MRIASVLGREGLATVATLERGGRRQVLDGNMPSHVRGGDQCSTILAHLLVSMVRGLRSNRAAELLLILDHMLFRQHEALGVK